MDLEQWLPIPGYNGYDVSDQGRVRSHKRGAPRILKPGPHAGGYDLYILGGRRPMLGHKAVMLAFVGPRPEGMQIRHLNGDPTDGRLANLRYGTPAENSRDAIEHGTWKNQNVDKEKCPEGHPYDEENTYLHVNPKTGWKNRQCKKCNRRRQREWRARQKLV